MSNVLITGTSSGFGFLTAKTLVGAGHRVFAGVRDMGGKGAQALKDIAASSDGKLTLISLDVIDQESVDRAAERAISEGGHLDVVINNAGLSAAGYLEGYTPEQFEQVFDI